jgi:uncharacterized protein YgiM (DUF1202 family)
VDKPPFAQTFVGAVLAAVFAGLIVWFLTTRQPVRVEATSASVAATPELRPREANSDVAMSNASVHRPDAATGTPSAYPTERTDAACVQAVIDDPDHYTNVRSGPGTNYEIVTRVVENEVFCVTAKRGRWWTIRTANGIAGYIYYDRVNVTAASKM